MGFLGRFLKKLSGSESKDLVFVADLKRQDGVAAAPLVPDETYIELFVESLRIEKSRAFATKFHGVVYSFASLAKLGGGAAECAAVTKPDKLAELDEDSIGKVLTISRRMMGAVPWRGGTLDLELGLFSVKSGNVLTPMLNFVTKVSDVAGISFVGAAKPFIPLISEGMDLLAGQTEDTRLVVGVDTSLTPDKASTFAIIATGKDEIDLASLTLDPVDGKLLLAGAPLKTAYCVFSLRATDRKPDFGEIPELKERFDTFRAALLEGDEAEAQGCFAAFRRAALSSPELISKDARGLVLKLKAMLDESFPAAGDGAVIKERGGEGFPVTLGEVPLYAD